MIGNIGVSYRLTAEIADTFFFRRRKHVGEFKFGNMHISITQDISFYRKRLNYYLLKFSATGRDTWRLNVKS